MFRSRQPEGESGQGLLLMMLALTVIFVVGVIVVDFGLWFTERRGAQKDADATTLAGAFELLSQDFVNVANNDPIATKAKARAAVDDWATFNDLPLTDLKNVVIDDTDCFGPSQVIDTVQLAAEHHSVSRFAGIFGQVVAPQIGAPAKACLGSENTAEGLLPLGVQISGPNSNCWQDVDTPPDGEEDPLFGQQCLISFGAGETTSGEAGHVRLFNDGSSACSDTNTGGGNTWGQEIENGGANTLCHVYKYFSDPSKYDPTDPSGSCSYDPGGCVYPLTGVGGTNTLDAFHDLIVKESQAGYLCDENYGDSDGIDELLEAVEVINGAAWPSPQAVFAKRDCKSPRTVSLLIVKQFGTSGNPPMPIEAFASFFIERCRVENTQGIQYSDTCDKDDIQGQIGQVQLEGYFLNILGTDGGVGQITKWSPKRIVLVE